MRYYPESPKRKRAASIVAPRADSHSNRARPIDVGTKWSSWEVIMLLLFCPVLSRLSPKHKFMLMGMFWRNYGLEGVEHGGGAHITKGQVPPP